MQIENRRQRTPSQWACALLAIAALGSAAHADVERFAYTYGWQTPTKGEAELEIKHTQPKSGHFLQDSASVEYGITDRWMIEPYIVYNHSGGFKDVPDSTGSVDADDGGTGGGDGAAIFDPIRIGSGYRYGGFQVETRYRFGDYGYKKLLTSAYLEYEQLRREGNEMEGKLIFQYDPNESSDLVFNLITEQPLRKGAPAEWGYSFGATYLADKKSNRYWVGGEAWGNWSEKQHFIGPSVGGYIGKSTRLVGTYGFQTQGVGGDQFRVMVSQELN
ncbi:MAG: hypothetical protein JWQ02_2947 [Capsulimonas sp.]|jgi:hypothetical protein|nr:hypothetical protein [Capsulimonas sp.]